MINRYYLGILKACSQYKQHKCIHILTLVYLQYYLSCAYFGELNISVLIVMNSLISKLQLQMTDNQTTPKLLKIFSLYRLRPECKIVPVRVDFASPHLPNVAPTSIVPVFNHDSLFFTPSFLLSSEKKHYQDNTASQKCLFEEKIQRCSQDNTNLSLSLSLDKVMAPAPSSNYCQICQEKFQDYFTHLALKTHILRSTNAQATEMINELCEEFRKKDKKISEISKTKGIQKQERRPQKPSKQKSLENLHKSSTNGISQQKGQNNSTYLPSNSLYQFIE